MRNVIIKNLNSFFRPKIHISTKQINVFLMQIFIYIFVVVLSVRKAFKCEKGPKKLILFWRKQSDALRAVWRLRPSSVRPCSLENKIITGNLKKTLVPKHVHCPTKQPQQGQFRMHFMAYFVFSTFYVHI